MLPSAAMLHFRFCRHHQHQRLYNHFLCFLALPLLYALCSNYGEGVPAFTGLRPRIKDAKTCDASASVACKASSQEGATITEALSTEDFKSRISNGVSVAMFSSPFCGPCLLMEPKIEEMVQEFSGAGVQIFKVNLTPGKSASSVKALFQELSVRELPTFLAYKDGELQGKVVGTRSAELHELISGLV